MFKTQIEIQKIQELLHSKFDSISDLEIITSGEFSQAFSFKADDQDLILRVNNKTSLGFDKEDIIHRKFPHILTPKILLNGHFEDYSFSISRRVEGVQMSKLNESSQERLISSLIESMNSIHTSEISTSRFGKWNKDMIAPDNSWIDTLAGYVEKDSWDGVSKSASYLNLDHLNNLLNQFNNLKKYLPNSFHLLHGDFGKTNIIVKDVKISGIIDWSESMYGDFLWDLAWITFWGENDLLIQKYIEFNSSNSKLNLENYYERIKAYHLVIGIHTLLFEAKKNSVEEYLDALENIHEMSLRPA
ncbi:MAG: phosphotransferase [Candidatus Dojkabacteria bacterium]